MVDIIQAKRDAERTGLAKVGLGGGQGLQSSLKTPTEAATTKKKRSSSRTRIDQLRQSTAQSTIATPTEAAMQSPKLDRTIAGQIKDPFLSVGEDTPTPTFGVPFIKPSERERGAVGFIPTKDNFDAPLFIQTSPETIVSRRLGRTKEDIIFTQRNILEVERQQKEVGIIEKEFKQDPSLFVGKKGVTKKGDTVTLTEEFFIDRLKPDGSSLVQAREFFSQTLPAGQRKKSIISGGLTGLGAFGVGIGEFGANIVVGAGVQELDGVQEPSLFSKTVTIGGELGKFRKQPALPTTTGFIESPGQFLLEKAGSPQLTTEIAGNVGLLFAGGASIFKNIRKGGLREGLGESAAVFSPIRIKPGAFTTKLSGETPIKLDVFKLEGKGKTTRIARGGGVQDPVSIVSVQVTKGKSSATKTLIETPSTIITPGGKIIEGSVISGSESLSVGKPGVLGQGRTGELLFKVPESVRGGLTDSISRQRFNTFRSDEFFAIDVPGITTRFKVGKGAGISEKLGDVTSRFGFGKREAQFGVDAFDGGFVRQPTGTFRFKPTATGREFDLGNIGRALSPKKDSFSVSGGRSQQIVQENLGLQIGGVQTSLGGLKTPEIKLGTGLGITPVVQVSSPQRLEVKIRPRVLQETVTTPQSPKFELDLQAATKTDFLLATSSKKRKSKRSQSSELIQSTSTALKQAQSQRSQQRSKSLQKNIQSQAFQQAVPLSNLNIGIGFRPSIGGGFRIPLDFPGFKSPKIKPRKERKLKLATTLIRPSFTGIVTGVETPAFETSRLGVLPGTIRGLETGFKVKKKKKKKKKAKKK